MKPSASHRPLLLAGLLALCSVAAQAQTAAPATDKPAPRVATRDELRACMDTEARLDARRKEGLARNKAVLDENAAVRAEAQQLDEEFKSIREDEHNKKERFNRKVKAHNTRVQAAQAAAATVRGELEALNKDLVAYNGSCGTIAFMPEDKEAILKERAAGKTN